MTRRNRTTTKFSLFAFQDIITSVTGIMLLVTLLLALELIQRKETSAKVRTPKITEEAQAATDDIDTLQLDISQIEQQVRELHQMLAEKQATAEILSSHNVENIERRIKQLTAGQQELQEQIAELQAQTEKVKQSKEQAQRKASTVKPDDVAKTEAKIEAAEKKLEEIKKSKAVIFKADPSEKRTAWVIQSAGGRILVAQAGVKQAPQVFDSVPAFQTWMSRRSRSRDYFMLLVKPDGIGGFDQIRSVLQQSNFDMAFDLLKADETAIDLQTGAGF